MQSCSRCATGVITITFNQTTASVSTMSFGSGYQFPIWSRGTFHLHLGTKMTIYISFVLATLNMPLYISIQPVPTESIQAFPKLSSESSNKHAKLATLLEINTVIRLPDDDETRRTNEMKRRERKRLLTAVWAYLIVINVDEALYKCTGLLSTSMITQNALSWLFLPLQLIGTSGWFSSRLVR